MQERNGIQIAGLTGGKQLWQADSVFEARLIFRDASACAG
jgi:hypothetical protein